MTVCSPTTAVAVAVFVHVAATGIVVAAYIAVAAVVSFAVETTFAVGPVAAAVASLLLGKHGVLLLHLRCHWISIRLLLILHHAS